MGNSLSGGQRQRVILARALYRRPKILFLDEATAHLDSAKEREISRVLQDLKITRVSIAHRSELAEAADVMLRFEGPDWETLIPAQSRAIVPGAASEARQSLASTPAG
jgi:ATP-binding cassette subfamily B protein RaxB